MTSEPPDDRLDAQKRLLTPESGFDLVGTDCFAGPGEQLYLVEHFEMYQDALRAKNSRKNPDEYHILYRGSAGEYLSR